MMVLERCRPKNPSLVSDSDDTRQEREIGINGNRGNRHFVKERAEMKFERG